MTRGFWVGFIVIAACVSLGGDLLAFSVGEIDVQSTANEPFRAEVPFVLEPHERDRELELLLGTPRDYQLEELDRAPILQHMHIILAPDKRDTVRIFSNVPIMDDAFDLLVLLRSGQLTIVRNFHVELSETPVAAAPQQVAVVEPLIQQAAADPVPTTEPTIPSQPPAPAVEPDLPPTLPPVEAQLDLPNLYGPIQRGATMYDIVSTLDVPRGQRWQAVVLLWRLNHRAFLRGNLHGLRVGAHLEVPVAFAERLNAMNMEASRQIIDRQWQAWRRRQVTTAAQAIAMTTELIAEAQEPAPEPYEEPADDLLPPPTVTPQVAEADTPPEEPASSESTASIAPQQPMPQATETIITPEEPIAVPEVAEAIPTPEEPVPDDSTAAIAPPQVVRLPTDEGSSFVSTQELKLLLGSLEDRLLRRLAPVQETQGTTSFVSPTELQISLQNLESRLTQRVEQMMTRGGAQLSPGPTAQPSPALLPTGSLEFVTGLPMPSVAYLLILINVILLVFGLTLGWRWWRQKAKGEA